MGKKLLGFSALLFVCLLFLQSVISIFVFDLQLKKIRRAFKWETFYSLPDEQLTLVKVAKVLEENPNPHFKREHSREFRFMGEMYDVVRQTDAGDTMHYYCFHDSKESDVMRHINRWMHDNFGNSQNSSPEKYFIKIFKQPYLPTALLKVFPPPFNFIPLNDISFFIPLFSPEFSSPPPEMI